MNKILLFTVFLFLVSCKNEKHEIFSSITINLEFEHLISEKLPLLDTSVIKEIIYLPLETNEDCLIGNVDRIIFIDNKIFISDLLFSKSIFVFDKAGKYLFKIKRIGRGPGEYLEPIAFDINETGDIFIYDNSSQRIIRFFDDGKKYETISLKIRFENFSLLKDGSIIVNNVFDKKGISSRLSYYNLSNKNSEKVTIPFFLYDELKLGLVRLSNSYFYKAGDTIYYWPRFTNKIYKIAGEGITEFINFSESFIPPKEFILKLTPEEINKITDQKYIFDIQDIFETTDLITLTYRNSLTKKILFISKNTGKTIQFYKLSDVNYFGDNRIYSVFKDYLISLVPAIKYSKNDWNSNILRSSLENDMKARLQSLTSTSNPAIILMKLKAF